ncbi:MAG: efflux RND transporter permease subunit, partial [Pleomorphochaeta sp.]
MSNKFFNFQNKHKLLIITIITVITTFFLINAMKLKVNADFTTIFNQTEATVYQVDGSFDEDEVSSLLSVYNDIEKIDPIEIANNPILESFNDSADVEYPIVNEVEKDKKKSSSLLLMIKSENLFTPVYLNTLDICLQNLLNSEKVQSISSVFDYVTIEKKGTRLKVSPISSHKVGKAWSDEEVETLKLKIANDPTATGYLVSQNLDSVLYLISISYLNENEIYELLEYFEPLNKYDSNYAITGALPINYRVMYYLTHDLSILLILCFVIILLIFYLSFRAKRSMILPFFLSILAIIWTFGTMSLLDIPITIINIITPCMVLVLGSSYSVHIVSEYYSKFNNGIRDDLAPIAASSIYKTIILAGLTTIAGFISLLVSKVDSLKEFGLVVSIGIVYCIIISLTLIPIILSLLHAPKEKQSKVVKSGLLTKVINSLSKIVIKKWLIFIFLYLLIILGFIFLKDKVNVDTNYMAYFPSSDRIVNDTKDISLTFGGDIPYEITIKAPENSNKYFLQPENLDKVYDFESTIIQSPDVLQNISFSSYVAYLNKLYKGEASIPESSALLNLFSKLMVILKSNNAGLLSRTISDDSNTIKIYLQCYDSINNDITTVSSSKRLEEIMIKSIPLLPSECTVEFGGTNSAALRFSNQLMDDQLNSQLLAYLLVFIIAALAFKSIYRGVLTLIPVSVGVMANYIFMYFLNIPFDMVTVSFASVAIGAGVDDAIHFLLKYSTLIKNPTIKDYKEAITITIQETGRPIVLTTISIVFGMLMLTFGSYMPIKYFGILMSVALMNSMLATIIILPSVIILVEKLK